MNSIKIHPMLGIKNLCALLFMYVTHLGCASGDRYQMEKEGTSGMSSFKQEHLPGMAGDRSNVEMCDRVRKFLDKKDFKRGLPITDEQIKSVANKLNRTVDMFDVASIDEEYKAFLNEYGSIDGGGFDIYGPTEYTSDSEEKIKYITSIQLGFENRCKMNNIRSTKVKSCWLIASIDQGDEYYINLSGKSKKNIYSISPDGKSKLFAKDFLEFLDKFFEAYERKSEEEDYQEGAYSGEGSDSD